MKLYRAKIWRASETGRELIEVLEFSRVRFTKHDYRNIVTGMFYWAATSNQYMTLTAEVFCEDEALFTITCDTTIDGAEISCDINVVRPKERPAFVRHMMIAA